jgi:gamma-glutamyltranspeptidase/glutathione hydrolase
MFDHPPLYLLLAAAVASTLAGCAGEDTAWSVASQIGSVAEGEAMVVTDHPLASAAAAVALERGGNAVDATVAGALALAVVRPEAGNLGGGGFMLVRMAGGESMMIDCRESAPGCASRDMFLDEHGELDPRLSLASGLASGVPGSVAGLAHLHQRHGRLAWAELVEPAIRLAEEGFAVGTRLAMLFEAYVVPLAVSDETARIFLRGGDAPYREGELLVQPDLARTLRRIRDRGAAGFYEGETAALLVDEIARRGGCMTLDDLAAYRVIERRPVVTRYREFEVISASPPSAGGTTLALMLHMVEQGGLGGGAADEVETLHRTAEIMRRAYALRSHRLGDPDFVEVPLAELLAPGFAGELAAAIDARAATSSDALAGTLGIEAATREGSETTHMVVVDRHGNVVCNTTSLNANFGSKYTVAGAGFLLNNTMDDFAAKPGTPNLFGLVQGEQNAVEPGKRPLSSMTPTIILRGGEPVMALGSPGGSRITNGVFQVILNQLVYGLPPERAVERPRIHHQFLPDQIFFEEAALDTLARGELRAMGHVLVPAPWTIGHVHLAARRDDGVWVGVADRRRGGAAHGLREVRE